MKNIPGVAAFLLIQLNGTSSKEALNLSALDQISRNGIVCSVKMSLVVSLTMALAINISI